jgi:thiol-disulfide isomerase/thioredoxin
MRFFVKNITFFIFLSLALLVFAGCSTTTGPDELTVNVDCMPDSKATSNSKSDLPKSEYPAAPATIMQAQLTKTDGTTVKLEDYKGKVLLVNLWATWCGPCKAEMPELVKLQNQNKEKGFEIIGLNADDDETPDIVKTFGEKMGLNYELVKSERALSYEFIKISKVDAIPQTFLINREGKLVGVFVGGGKNVEKIKDSVGKIMGSSCS